MIRFADLPAAPPGYELTGVDVLCRIRRKHQRPGAAEHAERLQDRRAGDRPRETRFFGTPEIVSEGAPFDNAVEFAGGNGMKTLKFAVLIHVEEIHSLRSGADAGKRMGEMTA